VILDARAGCVCRGAMVYREPRSSRPAGGGEYGDVRARIDNDKLNAYLANSVPALTVPVTIKQFKVRPVDTCYRQGLPYKPSCLTVWPG
jgi:hypothetical protein